MLKMLFNWLVSVNDSLCHCVKTEVLMTASEASSWLVLPTTETDAESSTSHAKHSTHTAHATEASTHIHSLLV